MNSYPPDISKFIENLQISFYIRTINVNTLYFPSMYNIPKYWINGSSVSRNIYNLILDGKFNYNTYISKINHIAHNNYIKISSLILNEPNIIHIECFSYCDYLDVAILLPLNIFKTHNFKLIENIIKEPNQLVKCINCNMYGQACAIDLTQIFVDRVYTCSEYLIKEILK